MTAHYPVAQIEEQVEALGRITDDVAGQIEARR